MSIEARDGELWMRNIDVKWAYHTIDIKTSSEPQPNPETENTWKPPAPDLAEIENWLNKGIEKKKIKGKGK
jgi:hypothetical protein